MEITLKQAQQFRGYAFSLEPGGAPVSASRGSLASAASGNGLALNRPRTAVKGLDLFACRP
jgi:hypothetical protein